MAKTSQINRNKKREKLVAQYAVQARGAEGEGRGHESCRRRSASRRASSWPSCRAIRPRCASITAASLSGRSKGYYRKVKMSRIALRSLSNFGQIPGMTKASW